MQTQVVSNLVLIKFDSPLLGLTIKATCITSQSVVPDVCSILTCFSTTFCGYFFKKNMSHVMFYQVISCYILAFTS